MTDMYNDLKAKYEAQRKLAVQTGKSIWTATQQRNDVIVEPINIQESLDFLEKMKFDGI
jgi:hypothetical protein